MSPIFSFQEMRYELAHLAHSCCDIDKFRVETCCVIGMYYIYKYSYKYLKIKIGGEKVGIVILI